MSPGAMTGSEDGLIDTVIKLSEILNHYFDPQQTNIYQDPVDLAIINSWWGVAKQRILNVETAIGEGLRSFDTKLNDKSDFLSSHPSVRSCSRLTTLSL
ncbi:hypothetical protein TNIN_275721 [Trichonephila inaurata madagascariensis]|uniref:Uncharacterized protein n=1 Tax=Trichonephila inaurata madagascariensis TaxID=2747483 RepID=A0A8X6WY45_9ARAC|nr:hypothetical protein TNIN_275721 [Trichonephila inaurata madagascariensis]